jgi:hypothetical protein
MCDTYIYSIGPTPKSVEYRFFRAISEVFRTAEVVFTGHIWPMAWTYLASRTCPGQVQLLAQTCPALEFSACIMGLNPQEP